jgi:uncharacterized membrane protein (DUF485 family)
MNRAPLTFLFAGFISGVVTVGIGSVWPMLLASGVGLVFFAALLAAIALTASWSRLREGLWRYLAGLVISTAAYIAGLFAFSVAMGYSPDLLGIHASSDISHFGADVGIGLLVAALVSSGCIEFMASILTGRWSSRFFLLLTAAGFATVGATYLTHMFARQPWAFFGVLLPVGNALFCWLVGTQIWSSNPQPLAQPELT